MSAIVALTAYTDLVGAGGTPVIDIPDVVSGRLVEGVDLGTEESLTFAVPRTSPALASIVASSKRVIRVWFTDGTFSEWPLAQDANPYVGGDGLVHLTCEPAVMRMAQLGFMSALGSGGLRTFVESYAGLTPSTYIDYVVTRLAALGASYITKGTITPTVTLDLEWNYATPLAVALQVRDAVKAKGVACEFDFRRNGSSGYYIDLVSEIGSSATVPELRARKSITELHYVRNRTRQVTVCQPKGPTDASGYEGTIARARWQVSAVNGGTKRLTLADPAAGAGPIGFDDQFNGLYLLREKTGRTFLIVDTLEATQEIELSDVSTFAAHSVTAPEYVSFRASEPLTGARRWGSDAGASFPLYDARWSEITAVGASTLTLTDNWGAGDPITVDDRFIDWKVRRGAFILATSFTMNVAAGRLDCASVTGVQAGDILVIGTSATAPYLTSSLGSAPGTSQAVVGSVDTVNKYLYCTPRFAGAWWLGPFTYYIRVFRLSATLHRISDSVAATNVVTVDAVGAAAVNDFAEILQSDEGTALCELTDAANVTTYGRRMGLLNRPETGEVNLTPNAFMRAWTGGASVAPDAWAWTGTGAATIARESTVVEHGPYSALCIFASGATVGVLRSPPAFINPTVDEASVSVRARVQFTDFSAGAEWDPTFTYTFSVRSTLTMTLYKQNPVGGLTSLGSVTVGCPGFANEVALDTWVDLAIEAVDISGLIDETLVVGFASAWNGSIPGGLIKGYVDAVQITQTATAPRALPVLLHEHGEAMILHQASNVQLAAWSTPPKEITVAAIDLERVDGTTFSIDALTKGGSARIISDEDSVDDTLRVLRMDRSLTDQADTQLTVATRALLLTDSLQALGGGGGDGQTVDGQSVVRVVRSLIETPVTAHTHSPDDLVGERNSNYEARGMDAGYRAGLVRMTGNTTAIVAPDGGVVTPIHPLAAFGKAQRLVIMGSEAGGNAFMDELWTCTLVPPFAFGPIGPQINMVGAPGLRTYAIVVGNLTVAIAGGGPLLFYSIRVFEVVS